jgi:hypothetical protein
MLSLTERVQRLEEETRRLYADLRNMSERANRAADGSGWRGMDAADVALIAEACGYQPGQFTSNHALAVACAGIIEQLKVAWDQRRPETPKEFADRIAGCW